MALKRLTIDGFGQVELNRVTFSRTGEVEAQCDWNEKNASDEPIICENGMLLAVDKAGSKVTFASSEEDVIGLNYSAEHMYDERRTLYKDFYLGVDGGNFCPRIGFLSKGDVFMTNCICYESEFADDNAVIAAVKACKDTALYGVASEEGAIQVTKSIPETLLGGILLKVVNDADKLGGFTMPDGQPGIKFQVVKA